MSKAKVASNPLPSQRPAPAKPAKTGGKFSTQAAPASEKVIADIGHNSDYAGTADFLRKKFEKIEKMEDQKRSIMVGVREEKKEVKNKTGIEIGAINTVLKLRRMERESAIASQTQVSKIMGMLDPEFQKDLFSLANIKDTADLPTADVAKQPANTDDDPAEDEQEETEE